MAEETVLSDDLVRQLINVGEVDLIVAVPTYNDARTIGSVVRAVRLGLLKRFPRERAVLVNADCGSQDGSAEAALQAAMALPAEVAAQSLRTFHTVTTSCVNGSGPASTLRMLLAAADLMRARACAVVAPSESVDPAWVGGLLEPIYRKDFDLVAPLYRRHKFDGLLVRTLLYPMIRAVWGKRLREPYAGDFGFSGRLGSELFDKDDVWQAERGEIGEGLLLSLSAVTYGYRICEEFLGSKEQAGKPADLVAAMRQAVGTLFHFLDASSAQWKAVQGSEPLPSQGGAALITSEPADLNPQRTLEMFQSGVNDLRSVLVSILTEKTLAELTCSASLSAEAFRFPDELWVRTVYEFAAAYHRSVINRDHIIQALVPVYRGKLYEFLTNNRDASAQEVEARSEALCAAFERMKPYLLRLWEENGGTP